MRLDTAGLLAKEVTPSWRKSTDEVACFADHAEDVMEVDQRCGT